MTPARGDEPERLLVTVAHPDDETFGCGSLLAHADARGVPAVVACATRGEAGTTAPGSTVDPSRMGAERERELRVAAAFLGVRRVEVLDWHDSGMDGTPAPGTLVAAPIAEVAAAVAALVEDVRPTIVVTLDGSDGHRDHAHIRDATLAAIELADWPVPRVYLQCLAQRLMRRWADELRVKQPDSEHLAIAELGQPEERITTVIDTSTYLARREQAMTLHASQVSPFEVMPPDLRREFLAVDRLRRVVPPWPGGPVETDVFS